VAEHEVISDDSGGLLTVQTTPQLVYVDVIQRVIPALELLE
jgi:hypothetical protein